MSFMNKILIGFSSGREIELETDQEVYELYKMADSQGFVDQSVLIFNISDVSYMLNTTKTDNSENE